MNGWSEREDVPYTADKGRITKERQQKRASESNPRKQMQKKEISNGARRQRRRNAVMADRISSDRRNGGLCGRDQLTLGLID